MKLQVFDPSIRQHEFCRATEVQVDLEVNYNLLDTCLLKSIQRHKAVNGTVLSQSSLKLISVFLIVTWKLLSKISSGSIEKFD